MSLRRRALVTTIVALVVAIVISLIVSQTILMRRFDRLEEREARQNVSRAVTALYSEFSAVNIAPDGDLTGGSVAVDGGETYFRWSLDNTTLAALGLNFILFAAPGQSLFAYGYDARQGRLAVP
jgi:sensor domain CHASE-containing protein